MSTLHISDELDASLENLTATIESTRLVDFANILRLLLYARVVGVRMKNGQHTFRIGLFPSADSE